MEYFKLQFCCVLVIFYVAANLFSERQKTAVNEHRLSAFDLMLNINAAYLISDGLVSFLAGSREVFPDNLFYAVHAVFLLLTDLYLLSVLVYIFSITYGFRKYSWVKTALAAAYIFNVISITVSARMLSFNTGRFAAYVIGSPVYICFGMGAAYIIAALSVYFRHSSGIDKNKKDTVMRFAAMIAFLTAVQLIFPETLMSCIGITVITVGIYLNIENPALKRMAAFQSEMVMGFATLIEKRDDSTGGHVRRTAKYAELIAKEMRRRGIYRSELSASYIKNLVLAAPMHDIGKISIPDEILRKPGKLTDDEYNIMKSHSAEGGSIIKETFRYLDKDYADVAYQVARHHHEKWNGRGYPDRLEGYNIPLCARIMAVADVFDAISENRCYRSAMPIDKCFSIIEEGSGADFDPEIVKVFLELREEVENIHKDEFLMLNVDKGT